MLSRTWAPAVATDRSSPVRSAATSLASSSRTDSSSAVLMNG